MVMHARKPQRISDGYFEKHQTHPYQNSKYGSSKGTYTDRYNHERIRDSPNGNSYRSDTPDSESPRERSYQNKIHVQKIREKERDRDYKSREKYSDCTRSPKEKRSRESRDAEHRTNHDRSNTEEKVREERAPRMGDWTEHISSSGKKYYYNCKTEISQWEKPENWPDRGRFKEKERDDRSCTSSSRLGHDKHSNTRASNSSSVRDPIKSNRREEYWNTSQSSAGKEQQSASSTAATTLSSSTSLHDRKNKGVDGEAQDMDISPGDSTPTSETIYSHLADNNDRQVTANANSEQTVMPSNVIARLATSTCSTPVCLYASVSTSSPAVPSNTLTTTTCNVPGPPTSLVSLTQSNNTTSYQFTNTITTAMVTGTTTTASTTATTASGAAASGGGCGNGGGAVSGSEHGTEQSQCNMLPLVVDTGGGASGGDGPPTPTHSETQDGADGKKSASPPNSISSLQTLTQAANVSSSLQALRQQGPHLTPSLSNYYRDDLVNHVRSWPAEALESQSVKLNEETHSVTSLLCTGVSAELKTARSIVRLTEINSTLNEQRILFLRQQIKTLEELTTQYSFMGSESKT